jgi:hypothetical protein
MQIVLQIVKIALFPAIVSISVTSIELTKRYNCINSTERGRVCRKRSMSCAAPQCATGLPNTLCGKSLNAMSAVSVIRINSAAVYGLFMHARPVRYATLG